MFMNTSLLKPGSVIVAMNEAMSICSGAALGGYYTSFKSSFLISSGKPARNSGSMPKSTAL